MAEEDNLVLRLLREVRADQAGMRHPLEAIQGRMTAMERHMEDVKESVTYALGPSAHANVAYETTGQRLDRLTETVEALKARVAALEGRQE